MLGDTNTAEHLIMKNKSRKYEQMRIITIYFMTSVDTLLDQQDLEFLYFIIRFYCGFAKYHKRILIRFRYY